MSSEFILWLIAGLAVLALVQYAVYRIKRYRRKLEAHLQSICDHSCGFMQYGHCGPWVCECCGINEADLAERQAKQ